VILDSSAVVAIIRLEPEAEVFATSISTSPHPRISAATWVETGVVVGSSRHGDLDRVLEGVEVVAFDRDQALAAREAYLRYGKGSGSRARLNLGDCFAYALAVTSGEPLLFKGDDFTHTDVLAAVAPG
jgi:ribonuclease VapC